MLSIVGHLGPPIVPSELWRSWNRDPVLWLTLLGVLVLHTRGWRRRRRTGERAPATRRLRSTAKGPGNAAAGTRWRHGRRQRWRRRAFVVAIVSTGIALLSPLDALSSTLASAHMVQHLLLTMVVAPLLVVSRPTVALLRGLPHGARMELLRLRRVSRVHPAEVVRAHPIACAAVHAVTLWAWHATGPYELALRNDLVHRLEHLTFLGTAVCSWAAVILVARQRGGAIGTSVLVLFGLSVQGSILGALLTFATRPWYPSYDARTAPWGLTPLEDQQLAGVIMWVPAGVVYLGAALGLMTVWIRQPPPTRAAPAMSSHYARG